MNRTKKLIAALLSAVMMITILPMTVSADSIFKTAKDIDSGKKVSVKIENKKSVEYKITPTKKGTASVKITAERERFLFNVYDSNGNDVELNENITSGRRQSYYKDEFEWNKTIECFKGTINFDVKANETYYIKVTNSTHLYTNDGPGKFELTFTYPTGKSSEKSSADALMTLTLKKGDSVQLGAVKSGAKWTSSDSSVASVTSGGLVKAKKKGETVITVKCGSETQSIKVIVE